MKTKTGEEITIKEAFNRFKKGLEDITPKDKLNYEVMATFVSFLGYLFSMLAVIYLHKGIGLLSYGLILIFLGSMIATGLKWLALRQQAKFFNENEDNLSQTLDEIFNSKETKPLEQSFCDSYSGLIHPLKDGGLKDKTLDTENSKEDLEFEDKLKKGEEENDRRK